jgi:membrane-bound ClpP family serine protease
VLDPGVSWVVPVMLRRHDRTVRSWRTPREEAIVIVLGLIMIIVGLIAPVPGFVPTIGWILLVVGLVLLVLGQTGRSVGTRKHYF